MKLSVCSSQEISPFAPPSKPHDLRCVSPLPTDPPVPPIPPDPPPVALLLLLSASKGLISGFVLSPFPTSVLSPALHLEKSMVARCDLPNPQVSQISTSLDLSGLVSELFSPPYMVLEPLVSTCVTVFVTHLVLVRLLTAICRFCFAFTSTIPPPDLVLKTESGWSLVLVITTLPRFEDVIGLSCFTVIKLPRFEAFDISLASFCFPCFALFESCRSVQPQPLQKMMQVYVDIAWLVTTSVSALLSSSNRVLKAIHDAKVWSTAQLSQGSASRRHVSSVLIAECLAIKSALLEAYSMGLQQLNVFSDSMSLVKLLRAQEVTNELKNIFADIFCLCDVFSLISFHFIPRLENTEADSLAKSALCTITLCSVYGA